MILPPLSVHMALFIPASFWGGAIMFALAFLILSSCFHGVLLLLFFKTAAAV